MKKRCYICNKLLNIGEFHKNRTRKDKHMSECKYCSKERARVYSREKYGHKPLLPRLPDKLKETHKQCPTCRQTKLRKLFYNSTRRHDGLSWQCKACENARKKESLRKRSSHQQLMDAKIHTRIENSIVSNENTKLDIIAHGVKTRRRKLPDNVKQKDIMDIPKKVYVTTRKTKNG